MRHLIRHIVDILRHPSCRLRFLCDGRLSLQIRGQPVDLFLQDPVGVLHELRRRLFVLFGKLRQILCIAFFQNLFRRHARIQLRYDFRQPFHDVLGFLQRLCFFHLKLLLIRVRDGCLGRASRHLPLRQHFIDRKLTGDLFDRRTTGGHHQAHLPVDLFRKILLEVLIDLLIDFLLRFDQLLLFFLLGLFLFLRL